MPKLTKAAVDGAQPKASEYYLWDDQLSGFGLRVTPKGSKIYLLRYRVGSGGVRPERKFRIGKHGSPWTADQARREALRVLGEVAKGNDPAGARKVSQAAISFADLADRYLDEHAKLKKKPASVAEDRRMVEQVLVPRFGQRRAKDLNYEDVSRLHGDLAETPYKANRIVALLSKMFALAERWGVRERSSNPCVGIEKFKEQRRERFLSAAELKRLGNVLERGERLQLHPNSVAIIRLLLMTGARRGEIEGLHWDEVNLERGVISKRDTKTGRREIRLSAPASKLLSAWPQHVSSPFVFLASRGEGHYQGLTKNWLRVRAEAELPDVRIHDLRHTFASLTVSSGASLAIVGKLLGHTSPATTARYAHLADDPVQEALRKTSDVLSERMG